MSTVGLSDCKLAKSVSTVGLLDYMQVRLGCTLETSVSTGATSASMLGKSVSTAAMLGCIVVRLDCKRDSLDYKQD